MARIVTLTEDDVGLKTTYDIVIPSDCTAISVSQDKANLNIYAYADEGRSLLTHSVVSAAIYNTLEGSAMGRFLRITVGTLPTQIRIVMQMD